MTTLFCPACELPNDPHAERCHSCGGDLSPVRDANDAELRAVEDRLTAARNQVADLEWRVRGTGWLAVAFVLLAYLVLGPHVTHPDLGGAVDCGSPVDALQRTYESSYAQTVWAGCESAARRNLPVVVATCLASVVGVVLLSVRWARLSALRAEVRTLVHDLRALRAERARAS